MSNLVKAILIVNAKKAAKKGWSDKARKSAAAKRKRKSVKKKIEVKETTVPVVPTPPVDPRPFLMGHAEMEALKQKMKHQRRDNPFPFFS